MNRPPLGPDAMIDAVAAARYEDLGLIGVGGMGEVRRVRDRQLDRVLAMKVIRGDHVHHPSAVARFVEEARVGAQLQHPGVTPVHEVGKLPDGRHYFTMKEVLGRPFADAIREAHAHGPPDDTALRRLVDVFAKVCEAVGYAHSRGVVHRDLKPDNVMLGAFGEVMVIDWGLAKVLGGIEFVDDPLLSARSDDVLATRVGTVVGTAAYMPPEQARGQAADARSDVYALGAMLYQVLTGQPPTHESASLTMNLDAAEPSFTPARTPAMGPADLVTLCERAMAQEPEQRHDDGASVATEARSWLDGAKRREAALAVVADALARVPQIDPLRARARTLRAESKRRLADVKPWEPEDRKAAGWASADEAVRLERQAALEDLKVESLLQAALTHARDLVEAHAALVEVHLARHRAADHARDDERAAAAEARISEHAAALPTHHEAAIRAAVYLRGDGALTLLTDPEGAAVDLYRYTSTNRRLVPVFERTLGSTPLRELTLARGSYLCVVRHPDRAEVHYPVQIGRGEHWHGVPPGAREPALVGLPARDALGEDDVYMPAGWFAAGGDPEAGDSVPATRLWCDAAVFKRFPVTNLQYLAFINDLVAQGRDGEALAAAPREEGGTAGLVGPTIYGRDHEGRFVLRADSQGDVWQLDWPVVMVDWRGAVAYCDWLARRTGAPWRLPNEFEREKAARGVDGRAYPWGDNADPSWSCMHDSHAGRPVPASVDAFPVDVSVYGIRGLGGNVRDWCADPFVRELQPATGGRVVVAEPESGPWPEARRVYRGGSWVGTSRTIRSACRFGSLVTGRLPYTGLRAVRSYDDAQTMRNGT